MNSFKQPHHKTEIVIGNISNHNVIITSLPIKKTGKASAATVARDMIRSFKSIRFGLMVGISGGVPYYGARSKEAENKGSAEFGSEGRRHIRLDDVVVSLHSKSMEAVVQYDFNKLEQGRGFFCIGGKLNNLLDVILTTVIILRGKIEFSDIPRMLLIASLKNRHIKDKFQYLGLEKDKLFQFNVIRKISKRPDRNDSVPEVHYRIIGSADQIMKNTILRNELSQKNKIIFFEIEATAATAAATAAAYAKKLLLTISGQDTVGLSPIEQSKQSPYISLESLGEGEEEEEEESEGPRRKRRRISFGTIGENGEEDGDGADDDDDEDDDDEDAEREEERTLSALIDYLKQADHESDLESESDEN
ncbi:hypothetical protein TWF788_004845 [Orbilia oligospora]|uniref:Uncharacterized protein n=1 Tax=Orbilia oligospora TaxID=2813651 RepID=A0A7C8TXQ5_ORBOL|nr:hypothetical protein TWF788_004845 [Orbilia oligospora]